MKRFLLWALIVLISASVLGCSAPVQQLSETEPIAQTQPNPPKAKTAWYDTHTANHIAYGVTVVAVGICLGYLISSIISSNS